MSGNQKGVTLLEVLVGFVIFTSTLVAVLDYVSGQVYHFHLSSANLQKVEAVYDLSVVQELGADQAPARASDGADIDLVVTSSTLDSFSRRGREVVLNQYGYSLGDRTSTLEWSVIRAN